VFKNKLFIAAFETCSYPTVTEITQHIRNCVRDTTHLADT